MKTLLLASLLWIQQAGTGAVSGEIRVSGGAAAAGVRVGAMPAQSAVESNRSMVLERITQTDDRGHYNLDDLPPGRYYIIAGDLAAPTYYPGTASLKDARIVTVASGSVQLIDFEIHCLPIASTGAVGLILGRSIQGRVVLENGKPLPPLLRLYVFAGVTKTLRGADGVWIRGSGTFGAVPVDRDGCFRLSLPDGDYPISLVTNVGDPLGPDDGYSLKAMVSGSVDLLKQKLKVVGRNADPIVITLIPR